MVQVRIRLACRRDDELTRFQKFTTQSSWQLDRIVVLRLETPSNHSEVSCCPLAFS